jgi:hypothetical protein
MITKEQIKKPDEILLEFDNRNDAIKKEIEFIKLYGRKDLGLGCLVNMTDGGEGACGQKCSDETREKKSQIMIGKNKGIKLSEEHKQKISDGMKRKISSGSFFTQEHRQKISHKRKNHEVSIITRNKISQKLKKEKLSPKIIKNCKFTKEGIDKLRKCHSRNIICLNNNIIYSSATKAGAELNLIPACITMVVRGKRNSIHGYKFIYA